MEFDLLGPLEVRSAGSIVALGGPRQRAVLAALLLHANQVSSVAYLTESVWEKPPVAPESNLRTYIAGLRRCLLTADENDSRLITHPGGYLLHVRPGESDVVTFEELTDPRQDTDGGAEVTLRRLERALALWRGRPLAGLPVGPRLDIELVRLADRRIDAALRHARIAAELGRDDEIVDRLRRLIDEYPLREQLWAQLIWALHRSGRQAEALGTYQQARQHLIQDLGIEPGPQLRQLEQRILAAQSTAESVSTLSVRRQLPMEIPEFTNRTEELRTLDTLAESAQRADRAMAVVAIEGMAGVGKTRLAIQAAHRFVRRGWFTEMQLWANLHGFDRRQPPIESADVLDNFLRMLGVPGGQVPTDPDARAALYRDRLAGKRTLVVLDNAANEDQVRPLLPGDPGCLVLVTSRRGLPGLEGAVAVPVGVLGLADSVALQAKIVGPGRIAAEPEWAARIATLCGHLPIALSLAARRLRTRPTWSVAECARRLAAGQEGIDQFDADQPVRATFDASYRPLPPEHRRVFRLLGLHPGHSCTAESVAALAGISVLRAETVLEHLLDENLLHQTTSGRYAAHDLVRSYAAGRAMSDESAAERIQALTRVLSWYLRSAAAVERVIDPHRRSAVPEQPSTEAIRALTFASYDAALAWCEAERRTLVDAVRLAADLKLDTMCWQLASKLLSFFYLRGYWSDWINTHQIALVAARRSADLRGQAQILRSLGNVHGDLRQHDKAIAYYQQAQHILVELDDRWGQAWNLNNLAVSCVELSRYGEAADILRTAWPLFVHCADRHGEAICLSNLADAYRALRQFGRAQEHLRRALDIQGEIGDHSSRRFSLHVLGDIHAETGEHDRAIECYRQFLEICVEFGDRRGAASAHAGLAGIFDASGQPDAALHHWRESLSIFEDLGSSQAEQVRARLSR